MNQSIETNGLLQEIISLDLEMIKWKLNDPSEGVGWNKSQCTIAEIQYKRFLTLNKLYPKSSIVPDKVIDTFWHYHILDTRKYFKDCDKIFGSYFHHFPYFGMRGDKDRKDLNSSFINTQTLFKKHFSVDMKEVSASCEGGGDSYCRNCVSSCSNGDEN
jgi:hypothetical protein